jgi:ArsR family transcriptional regulator
MKKLAEVFQALADETRLRLVTVLTLAENGVCVCELVDALRLPQYQVSRHLAVLKAAGLVEDHKEGTWAYYSLRRDLPSPVEAIIAALRGAPGEPFQEDRKRLELRMALRDRGRCVVGYDPDRPYREVIAAPTRK